MTEQSSADGIKKAWKWVPSLYFAEGVPYCIVNAGTVVLFKNMQFSNEDIAFYTSLLMLPWMLKPLWSPLVDIFATKKRWILNTQFMLAATLALAGFAIYFKLPFLLVWLLMLLAAFASATHDVAADGFFLIGLDQHGQAFFSGIRSTAYRLAMVTVQGGLIMLIGKVAQITLNIELSWLFGLLFAAATMLALGIWHALKIPAKLETSEPKARLSFELATTEFIHSIGSFFQKRYIGRALAFILLYRFAESQLVRLATPFLLDRADAGGLALSTYQQGLVYGTIGVVALVTGGILGGVMIARDGFHRWLWPMVLAINAPNIVYVLLAHYRPGNLWFTAAGIAVEQFGYGIGFTLYMLFMAAFAADSGRYRTTHYALMTGFMALGMMLPGMASGYAYRLIGDHRLFSALFSPYTVFFIYVCLATLPSFLVTALIVKVVPGDFGRAGQKTT
jgi:PAT family beta-lactamase induction signal transducer AmpG